MPMQPKTTKRERAAEWLEAQLAEGPKPAADLIEAARLADIGERTLRKAKDDLGAAAERVGGRWRWRFDGEGRQVTKSAADDVANGRQDPPMIDETHGRSPTLKTSVRGVIAERIRGAAEKEGLSVSAFLRRAALRELARTSKEQEEDAVMTRLLDHSVSELGLPKMARRAILALGVETIGELIRLTPERLLRERGFGESALACVMASLEALGLRLNGC